MFLSPIFLGLSAVFSGVLHYFSRFLAYSLAPVFYNLGIILGILFFVPLFGLWGLAYGVVLGAFLHLVLQIPAARHAGFHYLPVFDFRSSGLLKVFKLMVPRTIGTAAYQINLIVITAIASTLSVGSIAVFTFANNLQHFPLGIIGASFALAAFPALSRAWVNGVKGEFLDNFSLVFRQILFLIVPISVLMFLLRAQITRLILGTGQFGWADTQLTAASLGLFCLGIFAVSLAPFLARVFYSFQNTKTPLFIGLSMVGLNIGLAFLFTWLLSFENGFRSLLVDFLDLEGIGNIGVIGLPLAFSLSGIYQFSSFLFFLRKKFGHIRLMEVFDSLRKIIIASLFMAAVTYLVLRATATLVCLNTFGGLFLQAGSAFLFGIFIYFLAVHLLKSSEIKTIKHSIFHQFTKSQ